MNEFITYVRSELEAAGYTFEMIDSDSVLVPNTDIGCSGFFDNKLKLVRVATKKPIEIWLGVLVHEFCHFLQDKEKAPIFTDCYIEGKDCSDIMDDWFEGRVQLSNEEAKIVFNKVRDMELDCEIRTVNMIKQYNLPIEIDYYIQMANAYVLSHNMMLDKKAFIRAISTIPEVKNLPTDFLDNYETKEFDNIIELLF